MLRLMRDKAGSWFIKIILGSIVIVFIFWGVGSFRSQRFARVAEVNGEPIPLESYRQAYNNLLDRYRQQFGNRLDDKMIEMLNLRQQALDQLVDQSLLRQEAKKMDFRVTDQELVASIQQIPAFQSGGVFDTGLYRRVLNYNRLDPEEFEALRREEILVNKIRRFVLDSVKVSDAEALAWYQWNNATVSIDYVLYAPEDYPDIDASEEELQAYYEENKANYKTAPKVKAKYVRFRPADFVESVAVSDEEMNDYYENNPDEFQKPKTVEARHILLKFGADTPPEEIEAKRQKAVEIMNMAKKGQDFAELARQYSEGPTAEKGGYLGEFGEDVMVKEFSDKAFSMQAGEISEPVRTQFGWHIIKVEKVNEASEETFEVAKAAIRKKLADEKARSAAYDAAEAFFNNIFEGDDLTEIAEDQSLTAEETVLFTQAGPPDIIDARRFAQTAFGLMPMQVSDIQDFSDGFYIIQVAEKIPEETAPYEDVIEQVKKDLIAQKKDETARNDAETFMAKLKENGDWNAVCAESGKTAKESGFFKRNGIIPEVGRDPEVVASAFELNAENLYPESMVKGSKGYFIIRFKEKKLPEQSAFDGEKASVKSRLMRQKQQQTWDSWISELREESEIAVNEEMFK